jgi:hypothetical protein
MKIDQNLRAAIRSLCSASNRRITYQENAAGVASAIETLMASKPSLVRWQKKAPKTLARVNSLRDKAQELEDALDSELHTFGLMRDYRNEFAVRDEEIFAKSGGEIAVKTCNSADQILAQLATATDAEGKQILKDLGILWE